MCTAFAVRDAAGGGKMMNDVGDLTLAKSDLGKTAGGAKTLAGTIKGVLKRRGCPPPFAYLEIPFT